MYHTSSHAYLPNEQVKESDGMDPATSTADHATVRLDVMGGSKRQRQGAHPNVQLGETAGRCLL